MVNGSFVLMLALPVLGVMLLVPFFMVVDFIMEFINGIRS